MHDDIFRKSKMSMGAVGQNGIPPRHRKFLVFIPTAPNLILINGQLSSGGVGEPRGNF